MPFGSITPTKGDTGATGAGGATGAAGANGHGSTTTSSAPTQPASDWILHVADGTAFPSGAWLFCTDGTNSILGPILSGGGTANLTIDHTQQIVVGTVSGIANGSTVTFAGKTGATGPQGPAGRVTSNFENMLVTTLACNRVYALSNAGNGNTETDLGSDGQNGIWTNGSQVSPMVIGNNKKAALFDGSSAYLSIPTTNLPIGGGVWTIGMLLCELSHTPTLQWAWSIGDPSQSLHFAEIDWGTNALETAGSAVNWNGALDKYPFKMLIATYDGSSVKVYCNDPTYPTIATGAVTFALSYGAAVIGASSKGTPDQFANMVAQYWFLKKSVMSSTDMYKILSALMGN